MSDVTSELPWRERLNLLGRRFFELSEMLRLGFLDLGQLPAEEQRHIITSARQLEGDLLQTKRDLERTRSEVAAASDVEAMIKQIRKARIARVHALREMRKEERSIERAARRALRAKTVRTHPPYLGRRVSSDLDYTGTDLEALQRRGLPEIDDVVGLAGAVGLSPEDIAWLAFDAETTSPEADHYWRFQIPKRSGGSRSIAAPKGKMRQAQLWIKESIVDKLSPAPAAMAFRPGLSILDNAQRHADSELVVRLDVKDFFPSITFVRLRGWFRQLGYSPGMATVFALIVTDRDRRVLTLEGETRSVALGERALPQGACTSPGLANLIMRSFDRRVSAWTANRNWIYTRYADDLVFSTQDESADVGKLIGFATRMLREENFLVNERKTAVMRRSSRKMVTGLVLGEAGEVRLRRDYRRKVRAMLHRCETQGLEVVSEQDGRDALAVARGHIAFVRMVSPQEADAWERRYPWLVQHR